MTNEREARYTWSEGDIVFDEIPAKLKRIIDNAPKSDKERAKYIADRLESKTITIDEAQIIVGQL